MSLKQSNTEKRPLKDIKSLHKMLTNREVKIQLLKTSNKKLTNAIKLLLVSVKRGEIVVYHNSQNTTDYIQILENAVKESNP